MLKKYLLTFLCLEVLFIGAGKLYAKENEKASLWEKRLEFSYVNTSGNTDNITLSAKLNLSRDGELNRYYIKGDALYGEDSDEETQNKWSLDFRWERIFTKRMFAFLSANYLDDRFSGYDYRAAAGPGLGYDIVKTPIHHLKSLLSSLYNYDEFSEGNEQSDRYFSGKAEMDYVWRIRENLKFKENANYIISEEDKNKYFINSETALQIKVNRHISLGVSYVIAYQNFLPSPDIKHMDTTFLTSLIIDF